MNKKKTKKVKEQLGPCKVCGKPGEVEVNGIHILCNECVWPFMETINT